MSDLVKRLRDLVIIDEVRSDNLLGSEAADRIEALQARVAELEARLEIDHYYTLDEATGELVRHEASDEERLSLPDKIDCMEADAELAADKVSKARAKALEEAARVVVGVSYAAHYRTWPWWGSGNRSDDSDLVQFVDAAAAAIRALKTTPARQDRHDQEEI